MTTQVKTLNFLPEVFRTETNAQFFAATLDQLVAEPNLRRVEGFIGQTYGYSVEPTDTYVFEPTKARADYQLTPSVIFLKTDTQTPKDFISYSGILNSLNNQGAITNNNNRLFENEFYSWDGFVNLDMIVNYSQYYWMPNGPDSVVVTTDVVYSKDDYVVTDAVTGFKIDGFTQSNPSLTLLRGGTYTFEVNQASSFWIQGEPGVTGFAGTNINTRDVLGVTDNGITSGTVTFTVPAKDAQQSYNVPGNNQVSIVSTASFDSINGQSTSIVTNIDGVTQLNGKTLMFYNNDELYSQVTYYTISIVSNIIVLIPGAGIINQEKITVLNGVEYVGRTFYRDAVTGQIIIIPYISSILDTLYYQSGSDPLSVGTIRLIESNATNLINVDVDILGKENYISPNGITFINGLKVKFQGNTFPSSYENNEYYVAGVGSSINLLEVNQLLSVESSGAGTYIPWESKAWSESVWDQTIYVPTETDYIVIDRNSRDRNSWSRGNRWFNIGVINATIGYNGQATVIASNQPSRAQRPIIQFDGNLGLFNYGTKSLGFVDLFDNVTTDAFSQVVGQTSYIVDGIALDAGQTVIFNADTTESVRQSIYEVNFISTEVGQTPVITLTPTPRIRWWMTNPNSLIDSDAQVVATNNDQVYIKNGSSYIGTAWRFSRTLINNDSTGVWKFSQQKTGINQAPLFDIYNINGFSLSDSMYYPGTKFAGTKLFSYTTGTGANDAVLGFPISYTSSYSIGDIQFTVNLNSDMFAHQTTSTTAIVSENINIGYVYDYFTVDSPTKRTGYVVSYRPSFQYQVFEFAVTQLTQSSFVCDVLVTSDSTIDPHNVYVDGTLLNDSEYSITNNTDNNTSTMTLVTSVIKGSKVTILLLSDQVSQTAYYEIPSNLQNNPFNTNITSVNIGDLKNQYTTMFSNARGTSGPIFGSNNVYNLRNLSRYGTAIIQNSASMVLPGAFLRDPNLNLFQALQYNSDQYYNYKTLLISLTDQNDFSVYTNPAVMLDTIMYQISTVKNSTSSFFWSDMVPSGHPYITTTYPPLTIPLSTIILPLSRVFDFTSSNFWGLCVYLNTVIDGEQESINLISGVDYVVSDFAPQITINRAMVVGDSITINEYNQTYGSYCPNTPTKIGAYPAFQPAVILDSTYSTPTYFILGHDGSYNKLYGSYTNGVLNDFKDKVLFEFESRVYNNLKVSKAIPLVQDEVMPGQFRVTDYSYAEIIDIYTTNFLKWVGTNRIDFKSQIYFKSNQFTFNYNESTNILDGSLVNQGYWRGIYQWLYDTSNPDTAPWEMLGLVNEPTWWSTRYGAAPYTSDNTYMWQEIANGYVWNDGIDSYVNPLKIRSELLKVLPVNSAGKLLAPLPVMIENYNSLTFQRDWKVGDQGPAETSYLRSSSWPFDLMKLLALTKPAKFYNFFVDRDLYKYNTEFNQYLYNDRYHLNPRDVQVYGYNEDTAQGVSKASYINWVVDYIAQRGVNGTTVVTDILQNLDVRLTYNLAGFSSKQYLNFMIEKSTPTTQNSTLLIPDNSYSVLLYNNVPEDKIVYSSIIVQKTSSGYTVWGNSQSDPLFVLAVPAGGVTEKLTTNDLSVEVSADFFTNRTTTVAYGTLFYSAQGVSEFIKQYSQYLINQGMIFSYSENDITYTWNQLIRQFLWWVQQDWAVGSTISLNPAAKLATVIRSGLTVQPLTLQQQNFILNQSLIPLQNQNISVFRNNESFAVQVLNDGDTIAYTNFNLASIEHAVIFDNSTVFNDTIYDLVTGLRQNRLLLKGYKSGEWNGYMNAAGFMINEDDIQEWSANKKYAVGMIVTYKAQYWVANRLIQPQTNFVQEQWTPTSYDKIQTGLLPNSSTAAYESLYYYNTTIPNFITDADLSAYSLIGYRPRQYLADADLTLTTQINIYQQIIQQKGTNLIANAFKRANLAQGQIDYDIKENWAIKTNIFGSVLNTNFVECLLDQSVATGNPTIIAFTDGTNVTEAQTNINISDELINWEFPPRTPNFLPSYVSLDDERGLPTAGYVNLADAKFKTFMLEDLNSNQLNIDALYRSDIVWAASYRGSWNVFTPQAIQVQVTSIVNNLNGTITIVFASAHGLAKNDPIVLFGMDTRVNAYYSVNSVVSATRISVNKTLDSTILQLNTTGILFKLVSRKFEQASDQVYNTVLYSEFYAKRSWVDNSADDKWAVWQCAPVYQPTNFLAPLTTNNNIGSSVAYTANIGYLSADNSIGVIYRNYIDQYGISRRQKISALNAQLGSKMIAFGDYLYTSDSINGKVYVFKLNVSTNIMVRYATIDQVNTGAIAASTDGSWLYIADASTKTISVYGWFNNEYMNVTTIIGPESAEGFGTSISCSIDGVKLVVGAPYENLNGIDNCGSIYVYSRTVERFTATDSVTYLTSQTIPNQLAYVFVDDVISPTAMIFLAGKVVFRLPVAQGSIIEVSYGQFILVQQMYSRTPINGGNYGISVDTNKYGAQVIAGAPFDVVTSNLTPNVAGAAYSYTNGGQLYGSVVGEVIGSVSGTMFIDGYKIDFSGTASQIADQINALTPVNVVATASDNILQIGLINYSVETINNLIDLVGTQSVLASIGVTSYTATQMITNPNLMRFGQFGSSVALGNTNTLVISDPTTTAISETTFDYNAVGISIQSLDNYTIFDQGATTFVDSFVNDGVVYEFNYLSADNESIINPGQFVFGQYIQTVDRVGIAKQPYFGTSIANNDGVIVVGAPNWYANGNGRTIGFSPVGADSAWYIDKQPLPMVAINNLNNISIYNTISNNTLLYLDYIDPVQGKLLGAVSVNLDFIRSTDPAIYSIGLVWDESRVGTTWLDTTNLRMLNYNQPDINYNASNWGRAFPGSFADIYTWIVSPLPPVQFSGQGVIVNFSNYTSTQRLDKSTNAIVTDYFFWVKNYNVIPPGKTLSPNTLSQYIINPLSSGIAYLAPITTNIVALMNCETSIQSNSSALHLGYSVGTSLDQKHTSWTLVQENTPDEFLPGLPSALINYPTNLYAKFLDSFAGQTVNGDFIPSLRLPPLGRYGTDFYQSMFVNKKVALSNYVQYANAILIQTPIAEIKDLEFLNKSGIGYDTSKYWQYVTWWADGYSDKTKVIFEVEYYNDLQRIVPNQIIANTDTIIVGLQNGLVARVTGNNNGNSEYYVYDSITGWIRIGLENGTIQISSSIYSEPIGYDSNIYDYGVWDETLSRETYWIVRWLNEQCYTNELLIERNKSLILMFTYMVSEALEQQNYLPWLNKTSLINVSHRVRELLPYKKYQADNQEFLAGYLNEVKPFHVKINDFLYTYPGSDVYDGDVIDFDLPPKYNVTTDLFESPQMVYSDPFNNPNEYLPGDPIWSEAQYTQWYQHYGLSVINDANRFAFVEAQEYTLSQLSAYITSTDTIIPVKNTFSIPSSGSIYVGEEKITYDVVDRINNLLVNVTRGANNTTAISHNPNSNVRAILPPVIVIYEGRGYTEPPLVTLVYDTAIYPLPRTTATFVVNLGLDKVLSIDVTNPGSGYPVQPTVRITSSSIGATFSSSDINLNFNTISLIDHPFVTGDMVLYTVTDLSTVSPEGLTAYEYYYVRVIDSTNIALYYSLTGASNNHKVELLDTERVNLVTVGSGSNNSLAITAKAIILTSGQPVREMMTTIKFDRTSYGSLITEWSSDGVYAGAFTDVERISSSDLLVDDNLLASAQGALFPVTKIINIIFGQGPTMLNLSYNFTTVSPGQLNRQKVTMYNIVTIGDVVTYENPVQYYIRSVDSVQVQIYYDPQFLNSVLLSDYMAWSTSDDIAFLAEPFTFTQSLVTYANKLWQCVISNNNVENFNYDDWKQIYSNDNLLTAADRITAFYKPTANMSGRDLRQLMTGVTYPNATILGTPIGYGSGEYDNGSYNLNLYDQTDEFEDDANITAPPFNYDELTNPTAYDIQGGLFEDGYGPEELIPGIVIDHLEFKVTTDPATLPIDYSLNFRISVNKYGFGTVHNTNPFTQTSLSQDFVSTGSIGDVLYVENASKLVSIIDQNVTTDSNGVVIIICDASKMTAPIDIHIPNAFTFRPLPNNNIELTISGITSPTEIEVTTTEGNILLLNNEYIQFSLIDVVANTVTGLGRGKRNSITNSFVAIGTVVQSVMDRDKLNQQYYDQWWYNTDEFNPSGFASQTLEESTTIPAVFLKQLIPHGLRITTESGLNLITQSGNIIVT